MTAEEIAEALEPTGMCDADMIATVRHLMAADELGIDDQGSEARVPWLAEMKFPGSWPIKCEKLPYTENTWRITGKDHIGYALMFAAVRYPMMDARWPAPQLVIVDDCMPSGALGIWGRDLADQGIASVITATSARRVPHPKGGPPFIGTTPLCVTVPDPLDGHHLVTDMALTEFTYGDVLSGKISKDDLFFRDSRMWALGIALETLVRSMSFSSSAVLMLLFQAINDRAVRHERANSPQRLPGGRVEP